MKNIRIEWRNNDYLIIGGHVGHNRNFRGENGEPFVMFIIDLEKMKGNHLFFESADEMRNYFNEIKQVIEK